MPSRRMTEVIHFIFEVVSDKDLYSASVELLEMVCCFFEDQDMMLLPKKVQNPPVDLIVMLHPPQSLSL